MGTCMGVAGSLSKKCDEEKRTSFMFSVSSSKSKDVLTNYVLKYISLS